MIHCHHQNDFCIKMGSDESHFNVSVGSDGQSRKTVSTNHNLFEEKGEPKRYRTEVLPLTSLTAYLWSFRLPSLPLGQTGSHIYIKLTAIFDCFSSTKTIRCKTTTTTTRTRTTTTATKLLKTREKTDRDNCRRPKIRQPLNQFNRKRASCHTIF